MDELPLRIVKMHGARDEVIAPSGEFADLQSGVREGAVCLSRCPPGDAARGEIILKPKEEPPPLI
jgi:hypothetical protein